MAEGHYSIIPDCDPGSTTKGSTILDSFQDPASGQLPPFVIPATLLVIPAKAGIHAESVRGGESVWIPAFAGMTVEQGAE